MCVCVCVFEREWEGGKDGGKKGEGERMRECVLIFGLEGVVNVSTSRQDLGAIQTYI